MWDSKIRKNYLIINVKCKLKISLFLRNVVLLLLFFKSWDLNFFKKIEKQIIKKNRIEFQLVKF